MKQRFLRFMAGRYGADQLSRTLSYVALGLMVICLFLSGVANMILWLIALACIILCYARMFSKNISKRYQENQKYLVLQNRITGWFKRRRDMFSRRKTHRFFKCPQCSATARVPKGKGKIRITCPKCGCMYERKS